MNFTINGNRPEFINFNGKEVKILQYNGTTVWSKSETQPTGN